MVTMSKNILIITDTYLPKQNPRAFRISAIVNSLSKKHYKIDILMPKCGEARTPEYPSVTYYETPLSFRIDKIIQLNSNFTAPKQVDTKRIYIKKII